MSWSRSALVVPFRRTNFTVGNTVRRVAKLIFVFPLTLQTRSRCKRVRVAKDGQGNLTSRHKSWVLDILARSHAGACPASGGVLRSWANTPSWNSFGRTPRMWKDSASQGIGVYSKGGRGREESSWQFRVRLLKIRLWNTQYSSCTSSNDSSDTMDGGNFPVSESCSMRGRAFDSFVGIVIFRR